MAEFRCASSSRISEPSFVMKAGTSFKFFTSIGGGFKHERMKPKSSNRASLWYLKLGLSLEVGAGSLELRLSQRHAGGNQNHRDPKRRGHSLAQPEVRPG